MISPDVCSTTDKDGTTILSVEQGKVYSIIGIGSLIWDKLTVASAGLPAETIANELHADFSDVSHQKIEQDVRNFLKQLNQMGIVQVESSEAEHYRKIIGDWISGYGVLLVRLGITILLNLRLYTLAAFLLLFTADLILKLGGFRALHRTVQKWPRSAEPSVNPQMAISICIAVDRACAWYLKRTLCLQRSAIAACLLRSKGEAAEMVIGCRKIPFRGHAWVEINDQVVNDKQLVQQFYKTLDRC